jgi:hypothetical protein
MHFKLFRAVFNNSIDEINKTLVEHAYDESNLYGFFVDKFINKKIEGRFVYKKVFGSLIKDPFGNEIENEYIVYETFNFIIDKNNKLLILLDSPRDIKIFLSSLSVIFDYNITVEPLKIDLLNFSSFLSKTYSNLQVVFIEIDGLTFSPITSGKILLSGDENILQYIEEATFYKENYQVKKIALKMLIAEITTRIDITHTGIFKSSKKNESMVKENVLISINGYLDRTD